MAKITKASLEQAALEMAAFEEGAHILTDEEKQTIVAGRYSAYTSFGMSDNQHEAHALAGLDTDLLSTQVGREENQTLGSIRTCSENWDRKKSDPHGSGYFNDCLWRCISYLRNNDGSAEDAQNIATDFHNHHDFQDADASGYLSSSGAATSHDTFNEFKEYDKGTYDPSKDEFSIGVIPDYIVEKVIGKGRSIPGMAHAVVIKKNADGTATFFDPSTCISGVLQAGEYEDWIY